MFITEELNAVIQIFLDREPSKLMQNQALQTYVNLEATLLRAKVLRNLAQNKLIYIAQSLIKENEIDLGYLFAPFILANLNQPVIYSTPKSKPIINILGRYYDVNQQVNIKIQSILESLKLYLDLTESNDDIDFLFKALIQALCQTDLDTLFLITDIRFDEKKLQLLQDFLDIKIYVISTSKHTALLKDHPLSLKKLLFKSKDDFHRNVCKSFSEMNANLVVSTDLFTHQQATHLVEDMFYSEHIFEKLSIYAEYIQTHIQNDQALGLSLIQKSHLRRLQES
ncbi:MULTISPECIES: hypothetical protein [Acinetobacter]|uniref:Uncharacterized protein n=1 Tax=Acinetobacter baylyi (strain ATCC 33305 / BD413 / ADP1) TaxID=62977 RepID=Q6FAR0_ACIAD|nr:MULTISPECIES: hypothetical protein [Acinetobacter]ENV53786.1 hypothetical protein F952_01838 [Acinetobacter baylyi DSM 14961 = CIP 107474]KAF2373238.1 hypothetical protein BSL88_00970 [Acinetobacter baylyi]KAF2374345.1 hypothetical protein BSL67_06950 [Acinetobacter baylyi]KAF2378758.1 hypothetical protein BSN81_01070 [Acinetobacter baylyi]KAF2381072.1 hypothetical protein BSN83_08055 [Acinetobacter baylyi]